MLNAAAAASALLLLSLPTVESAADSPPSNPTLIPVYKVNTWSDHAAAINLDPAGTGPLEVFLYKKGDNVRVNLLDRAQLTSLNGQIRTHSTVMKLRDTITRWALRGLPTLTDYTCTFSGFSLRTEEGKTVTSERLAQVVINFTKPEEAQAFRHDCGILEKSPALPCGVLADITPNGDFQERVPRWSFRMAWQGHISRSITTDRTHLNYYIAHRELPLPYGWAEKYEDSDTFEGRELNRKNNAKLYYHNGKSTGRGGSRPLPPNVFVERVTNRRLASAGLINRITRESVPKRRRLGWKPSHDIPRRPYESKLLREHERC